MAGNVYYAKPVTVTDERVRDAMEKQAKQRAQREALDSQVETRRQNGGTTVGLSKAQLKRQEVLAHQQELQRQNSASLLDASGSALASPMGQQQHYQPPQQPQPQAFGGQSYAVGIPSNGTYVHPAAAQVYGGGMPQGYAYGNGAPGYSAPMQRDDEYRQAIPQPPSRQPVNPVPRPGPYQPAPYEVYQAPPSSGYHEGGGYAGDSGENVRDLMNFISKATELPQQHAQNQYTPSQQQQRDPVGKLPSRAQSKEAKNRGQSSDKSGKVALSRVEQLQKELADRQQEMQRMRDKERDWEQQVKQLKGDLKNARQKEKDLSKLVGEKPQRAETAPNPSSSVVISGGSQRSLAKLLPLERQSQNLVSPQQFQQQQQQPRPLHAMGAPASAQKAPQAQATRRADFNNTKVYSSETFRPITAPLEPIADVRESTSALPPLPDSLKMASFNTRKVAFGLPKTNKASEPVALDFSRLMDFVASQVVTKAQADTLWAFFAEELSSAVMDLPKHPTPPAQSRISGYAHPQQVESSPTKRNSRGGGGAGASTSSRQTYETYAELDEGEGGEEYDDDYDEEGDGGAESEGQYYSPTQVAYR